VIAELTEFEVAPASTKVNTDTASPTMPLPRLDFPIVRSQWLTADGRVFDDPQGPPIAGLAVSLRTPDGVEIARTTTDSAGNYRFDDIPRGDYTVVFTVPSGAPGSADRIGAGDRRPASYWSGDSVVPTPVHTWLPTLPSQSIRPAGPTSRLPGQPGLRLEGSLG
jgi:Carboxypeptidase regulatory-like domain